MTGHTPDGAGTRRYDDLRALFINCTLKRSPELSHTQGLISRSQAIMDKQGVTTEVIRAVDHDIAAGVWPDMTEQGWPSDDWPRIYQQVPGPSYLDEGSGGPDNDFTNRNTTFMTWNLLHLARMLKDAGGIPAHGNQRSEWDAGCRFDFENPDYR
jgi:hypothetical protein